jgi:hypothetical protein
MGAARKSSPPNPERQPPAGSFFTRLMETGLDQNHVTESQGPSIRFS